MWWWAVAGGVVWGVLFVAVMALRDVDPRKRWLMRRLLKSSSASTGSDGAKDDVECQESQIIHRLQPGVAFISAVYIGEKDGYIYKPHGSGSQGPGYYANHNAAVVVPPEAAA